MSTANDKPNLAIESTPTREPTPQVSIHCSDLRLHEDQGLLLAQIPDLDPKPTPAVPRSRIDGRIISQALSFKLVFGIGIGLVVGAILPYLFGKVNRPAEHVSELSTWTSPNGATRNTAPTTAPAWQTSPAPSAPVAGPQATPTLPPAILSPQPPRFGDNRPTTLAEPGWPQQRPSPASTSNYINPTRDGAPATDNRGVQQGFDRPATSQTLQADNRSDPVARFDAPAGDYTRTPRYGNPNSDYPPATNQGNLLMPPTTPGANANYHDGSIPQPGVARFDGTIAPPPIR